MNFGKRLLAASGAAALLGGLAVATPAFAASPFTAQIEMDCLAGGQTQLITVNATTRAIVHIEVTINGSTANGGTQKGTGVANADGVFTDQWVVADVTASTTAIVTITVLGPSGAQQGGGQFTIHPSTSGACQSPTHVTIQGSTIGSTQIAAQVKKTCDAGLTGSASFTVVIKVSTEGGLVTINVPASTTVTLLCNDATATTLAKLPVFSTITLHEVSTPMGAVAVADTTITVSSTPGVTTIHNAKAAVVARPTPRPPVLPATGKPAGTPNLPWSALALLGLVLTGLGLRLLVRQR
ncbi:MAG: hypothetical protein M3077_11625 [Candidatus Dormibacteraeota bacterium]|nr:hypothetical protein [Candidatus Dormibacteraeota bacterium]